MNGNIRDGIEFAVSYLGRIFLAFLLIVLFVYILQWFNLHDVVVGFIPLLAALLKMMAPFVLLTVLAYAAGYCPPGTKDRMYIRILMSAFIIFNIFFVAHAVAFDIDSILIDDTLRTYARDVSIHLNLLMISVLFIVLPITSAVDSVLEYRETAGKLAESPPSEEYVDE